jgi:HEAT repeat protein
MALESMGPAASPAVPALVKALGDADGNVRLWAAKALGAIGAGAREAVPALAAAARHDALRGAAEESIRRINAAR